MSWRIGLVIAGALAVVGCSDSSNELTPEELANAQVSLTVEDPESEPALVRIARTLTYYQGIANFCGDASVTAADDFLDELALSGISTADLGFAVEAAAKAKAEFDDAEEEYVCTPEMFEQSEAKAGEALVDWAVIKELAQ